MGDWIVTYSDGSTSTVIADDVFSASSLAYGQAPEDVGVTSVIYQTPTDSVVDAARAKLVQLGLTEDEATAIVSSNNSA